MTKEGKGLLKKARRVFMALYLGRCGRPLLLALVLGASSSTALGQARGSAIQGTPDKITSDHATFATSDQVVAEMIERNRSRAEALRQYSALRTYEIRNSAGKLGAQAVVKVDYEAPDKKRFNKKSEKGSLAVRRLVFDRLIQSELETSSGAEHHNSAITSENYTFTRDGEAEVGPYHCLVFAAIPKRKEKYLFQGKIWIDADDFAIVKIAGHPASALSFWIKQAEFVREYQKIDGFWLPCRDETVVDVRIYGRIVFSIDHQHYTINSTGPLHVEAAASIGDSN